ARTATSSRSRGRSRRNRNSVRRRRPERGTVGSPARAPRVSRRTRLAASIEYFSRAAAELALTQPAVSQQIRALELQLGERLIERGPGSFALTEHGALLLEHADALWERLRLAKTQLGEPIAGGRRRLRIGAFPSVLATLVPAAIAGLHQSVEDLVV